MPGPDDLRREADRLEQRAAELRREADALEARAASLLADPLTSREDSVTLTSMQANNVKVGRPLESHGPVARAARHSKLPMRQIAEKLGVKYTAVQNWDRRRRAPDEVKAQLAKPPYSVPLSAWKK